MNRMIIATGFLLAIALGGPVYQNAVAGQNSALQDLEDENAELKQKLDNIQDLVTQAKSDLDDTETEAQRDESCTDTDAYSDATDVEAKLNDIESEASY